MSAQGKVSRGNSILGALWGTAVADAVGLVSEGLSPSRRDRWYPEIDGPRFLGKRGMVSDDTEHTAMVAQALIASGGEGGAFSRSLAWRLRGWLIGAPAGIGFATLRALIKLWLGFSPEKSGVFSAGNGPAMRSPVIGATWGDNRERMVELVRRSTVITHSDPKAFWGAVAAALAAYGGREGWENDRYVEELNELVGSEGEEFLALVDRALAGSRQGQPAREFAGELGPAGGVTGYVYHTMAVVLQVWFRRRDNYELAVKEIISCGGDTDTTAAILGGILGANLGPEAIPSNWRDRIWEWPRSMNWLARVAHRLEEARESESPGRPVPLFWPAVWPRNAFFAAIVLGHGFRRMLPPY